ncbi:PadR family transcriptional regulator [Nonomuraea phyllanthi]|uniref:PadR family transcriptional regulator n=1 Tax=Nonomuraea phyllanthi TaxID=2219224 RepID=A0A5C4WRR4_9ACTN|nr:PadR family transcriptional regulator [Nonomuraea phyllanthi]KAB8196306.1 PadR family transcriptional regulator [Nonomuraea phyllanthi]QFY05397.1 PadR family transcriptional regulator [Nonomuraea phyllanthi]
MAQRHSLVGLTVLALLTVRPSHPYELHRFIIDTHKDYVTGLPRSLYHAVERLVRDELIVPAKTDREGRRPERTVYEITDEGREELATQLCRLLEKPEPDRRGFVAGVSLLGCLPPGEAQRALRGRAATIEGMLAGMDAHMRAMAGSGMPEILMVEVEYEHAVHTAELDWIRRFLDRLDKGELDWPTTAAVEP